MDEVRKNLAEVFELPKDVMLSLPKITMIGNLQIHIENHKEIIEYSSNLIRILAKNKKIVIQGEDLTIKNIVVNEINIIGKIEEIQFVD